jgi:hypothetical protein
MCGVYVLLRGVGIESRCVGYVLVETRGCLMALYIKPGRLALCLRKYKGVN